MLGLSLLLAALLALVHVLTSSLKFLDGVPRSRLLSLCGGVSVAYVFMHLLPELAKGQTHLGEHVPWLEQHIYLIALASFAIFYGLERLAQLSRSGGGDQKVHHEDGVPAALPAVFWLHIGSFTIYNALIGYLLLHREERGAQSMIWFAVAMALHFVVNDHGLHDHHQRRYERYGRWLLASAVLIGWAVGVAIKVNEATIGVLLATLAGGVILNVIKEELPEERRSRWWAFAAGAAGYAVLLLLV